MMKAEISPDTTSKINKFAKEQSVLYLNYAEMTYAEKVGIKARQARDKASAKLARLKSRSEQSLEAQNDLALYMNDYIGDLMSQGMTESSAFGKAQSELAAASHSRQSDDLRERFEQYYSTRDPAVYETIGLFYSGFTLLGMTSGGLLGFLISGGLSEFSQEGWIYTLIGIAVGCLTGVSLALIANAIISLDNR